MRLKMPAVKRGMAREEITAICTFIRDAYPPQRKPTQFKVSMRVAHFQREDKKQPSPLLGLPAVATTHSSPSNTTTPSSPSNMQMPLILLALLPPTLAIPSGSLTSSNLDTNPLAHPFRGSTVALLPARRRQSPAQAFALLRRQGCPNLTLLCPSGVCCPYGNDCCGGVCCNSGYLCTGGTSAAPCCVAIGALTNDCGGESGNVSTPIAPASFCVRGCVSWGVSLTRRVVRKPCTRAGDLPCVGVNICCPPASVCYYDAAGFPRCAPQSGAGAGSGTGTGTGPGVGSDPVSTPTPGSSPSPSPSPSPRPNPTPRPDPDPPRLDDRSSIWTPAMIGGVAGGSAGGLLLLSFVIWCCCRRRGSTSSSRNSTTISAYRPPPRVQRLTDDQVYRQVYGLSSPNAWQAMYTTEAKRIPRNDNIDPAPWMADFATRAVSLRIAQVRTGDKRKLKWVKSGFIGAIPFVSPITTYFGYDNTKSFRHFSIDCLGLGDSAQLAHLQAQAKEVTRTTLRAKVAEGVEWAGEKAVEHWWDSSDLAAAVQAEMMQVVTNEFGAQAAQEFAGQLVHGKPVVGQIAGATRGVITVDRKMIRVLEWLQPVAVRLHLEVFVVNALNEVWGGEH
jgi:hypothetical protein